MLSIHVQGKPDGGEADARGEWVDNLVESGRYLWECPPHRTEHDPERCGGTSPSMGVDGPAAKGSVDRSSSILLASGDE
jgi:hypothetical protein